MKLVRGMLGEVAFLALRVVSAAFAVHQRSGLCKECKERALVVMLENLFFHFLSNALQDASETIANVYHADKFQKIFVLCRNSRIDLYP